MSDAGDSDDEEDGAVRRVVQRAAQGGKLILISSSQLELDANYPDADVGPLSNNMATLSVASSLAPIQHGQPQRSTSPYYESPGQPNPYNRRVSGSSSYGPLPTPTVHQQPPPPPQQVYGGGGEYQAMAQQHYAAQCRPPLSLHLVSRVADPIPISLRVSASSHADPLPQPLRALPISVPMGGTRPASTPPAHLPSHPIPLPHRPPILLHPASSLNRLQPVQPIQPLRDADLHPTSHDLLSPTDPTLLLPPTNPTPTLHLKLLLLFLQLRPSPAPSPRTPRQHGTASTTLVLRPSPSSAPTSPTTLAVLPVPGLPVEPDPLALPQRTLLAVPTTTRRANDVPAPAALDLPAPGPRDVPAPTSRSTSTPQRVRSEPVPAVRRSSPAAYAADVGWVRAAPVGAVAFEWRAGGVRGDDERGAVSAYDAAAAGTAGRRRGEAGRVGAV